MIVGLLAVIYIVATRCQDPERLHRGSALRPQSPVLKTGLYVPPL